MLTNMRADELLEVKIAFELIEMLDADGKSFAGRLKCSESVSLAGMPSARGKKAGHSTMHVPIPDKVLRCWREDPSSRTILCVRATSVQPTTNFRALTNTVEFSRAAVLDDATRGAGGLEARTCTTSPDATPAERMLA